MTHFVCVEASAEMLEVARRAVPRCELGRVEFLHQALPRWIPERAGFDLVVTHFFLDCFPPQTLERVVGGIAEGMRRDASWLIVDSALPARGPARWRARIIHSVMYAFFRWATRFPGDFLWASGALWRGLVHSGIFSTDRPAIWPSQA